MVAITECFNTKIRIGMEFICPNQLCLIFFFIDTTYQFFVFLLINKDRSKRTVSPKSGLRNCIAKLSVISMYILLCSYFDYVSLA